MKKEKGMLDYLKFYGKVTDLTITGKIISNGDKCGSIMSTGTSGTIEKCTSYVNIESTGSNTGGITGSGGTVKNSKNYGHIKGTTKTGRNKWYWRYLYRLRKPWRNRRNRICCRNNSIFWDCNQL